MKLTLQQKVARRAKVNFTARTRLGTRITSVEHLAHHAADKRSVYCLNCWGLLPAIVVMNMAASCVHRAIQNKCVFEYISPSRPRAKFLPPIRTYKQSPRFWSMFEPLKK